MILSSQLQMLRSFARDFSHAEHEEIVSLIAQGNPYAELFFNEIQDGAWLSVLNSHGFFTKLPEPEHHADGSVTYRKSEALFGLERLASKNPEAVVKILLKLPPTENILVGDQLMRCMLAIREAKLVPQLLPLADSLIRSGNRSTRLFLKDLLKSWVDLGCGKEALKLLSVFITVIATGGRKISINQQAVWELTECDTSVLVPMIKVDPASVADICFKGLTEYYDSVALDKDSDDEGLGEILEPSNNDPRDYTYWIEDFKHLQPYHGDGRVVLAHRLYAALLSIYRSEKVIRDAYDDKLKNHPWQLFKRLRCQLYADVPRETLDLARRETLDSIGGFDRLECRHNYEFASMLEAHVKANGNRFLTEGEVQIFVKKVLHGPIDQDGKLDPEVKYQNYFRRRQLWPIRDLLSKDLRQQLEIWNADDKGTQNKTNLQDYKRIRSLGHSGTIKDKSPFSVDELGQLSDDELWHELNFWKKSKDWIEDDDLVEESTRELAATFTELIAKQPDRFVAGTQWWTHIKRPIILAIPLETWAKIFADDNQQSKVNNFSPDTELAFGLMSYIVSANQDQITSDGNSEDSAENPDWSRARLAAVHYLNSFVINNPPENSHSEQVRSLLSSLILGEEARLDRLSEVETTDWQFEAINSVRGMAWDTLIHLALKEKNFPEQGAGIVSDWITDLLAERLSPATQESPAIFSLIGSKLRFVAYSFTDWLKDHKNLLFPPERPSCLSAFIDGHFAYDQPHKVIVSTIPEFLAIALDNAEQRAEGFPKQGSDSVDNTRDVTSRLGFHISFYNWNAWFADKEFGQELFERFLNVAPSQARAETLGYIRTAFEKVTVSEDLKELIDRTHSLLALWFKHLKDDKSDITQNIEVYDAELGQFADLIAVECFPFEWRIEVAQYALSSVTRPRWAFRLLDTLEAWSEDENPQPERIKAGISLLGALTNELNDELRWSIQVKKLEQILKAGLKHYEQSVKDQTNQVIENLLRHGFFELLDLGIEDAN